MNCAEAAGRVYNIGSSEEITIESLADKIIEMTGSGSVFRVEREGDLTVKDTSTDNRAHTFTVGSDGVWALDDGGEKTVTGGVITGGDAEYGGGVYIDAGYQGVEGVGAEVLEADSGGADEDPAQRGGAVEERHVGTGDGAAARVAHARRDVHDIARRGRGGVEADVTAGDGDVVVELAAH